jgi:CcmD family protein
MASPVPLFLSAQPAPTGTAQSADDRAQSFVPVKGGGQLQSGERLLVIAYMAIWLCVVMLIVLSFRKQARLDRRIAALEAAVDAARSKPAQAPQKGVD